MRGIRVGRQRFTLGDPMTYSDDGGKNGESGIGELPPRKLGDHLMKSMRKDRNRLSVEQEQQWGQLPTQNMEIIVTMTERLKN
ncbi:hypothetical protein Ddc_05508 [Ditylenchus destructor]|nr:hypothetical protein Ddc_05508 [Ditylenchus destructor]